jgi:hypothetical protein
VQDSASKWAQLRTETNRLQTEGATDRSLLEATLINLTLQADELELQKQAEQAEAAKARQIVDDLVAANLKRQEDLETATNRVAKLSRELIALRSALPPRLSSALELPFLTIADPELIPADRMRHTMAILNRCQQFDQTYVFAEEVVTVTPGSEPRLLEVVYFGLAQACALDRSASKAYIGRPVDGTWQWENVPGLAAQAERLLEVREDIVPPEFVELPFQITGGAR